jgi:hypothetical protein
MYCKVYVKRDYTSRDYIWHHALELCYQEDLDGTYHINSKVMCIGWGTLLVAQLVEALRYKSEGRGFDSRWCHWNFSLT